MIFRRSGTWSSTRAPWRGPAESRGATRIARPGRRAAAEQAQGSSMCRSACVSSFGGGRQQARPSHAASYSAAGSHTIPPEVFRRSVPCETGHGGLTGICPGRAIAHPLRLRHDGISHRRATARGRRSRHACAVGRTTISFTSISAGCSIANAIARAIAAGGIANLSRAAASWAFTSGFVTPSAKFVWTKPGEMIVTRSLSPASCRKPSEMARTANFVPE